MADARVPDMATDPMCVVMGATAFIVGERYAYMALIDEASVWIGGICPHNPGAAVPPVRVEHQLQIGTVDALVADYREHLQRTFKYQAGLGDTPENDVAEQQVNWQRHVDELRKHWGNCLDYSQFVWPEPYASPELMEKAAAAQRDVTGFSPRQSFEKRERLMRLVGDYLNCPPTDEPELVATLIADLVTLQMDGERRLESLEELQ